MSHIDSFKHEIVGLFGGLPVYHPLEDINGDFKCSTKQLVIGGGSGEHPALVIENPLAAVACFINESLKFLKISDAIENQWTYVIEPFLTLSPDRIFKYYEWSIETYSDFAELCKSTALPNPFFEGNYSLEAWLILGIGEFIFFSMPDLATEIMSQLQNPYQYFYHMQYNNIMLIPPNFSVYANGGNAFTSERRHKIFLTKTAK